MRGWLVVIALASGCFGEDNSSGGPYVALVDVETATRTAECQFRVRCHLVADEATCLHMPSTVSLIDPFIYPYIQRGQANYRGEQMAACLDELANHTCDQPDVANETDLDLCVRGMISGTLHQGAACSANVQCISQLCDSCGNDNACCASTCLGDLAPPRFVLKHLGATCLNTGGFDDCDPTSYCDVDTTKCVATFPAGAACNTSRQCDVGLTCGAFTTSSSTCVRLPRLGETCTNQCGEVGTYCSAQGICTAYAHPGESCMQGQQCDPFSTCDFSGGSCQRGPGLHEACGSFCDELGTFCSQVSQMCELQVDEGGQCQEQLGCVPGAYCDLGRCTKSPDCTTP